MAKQIGMHEFAFGKRLSSSAGCQAGMLHLPSTGALLVNQLDPINLNFFDLRAECVCDHFVSRYFVFHARPAHL